MANYYEQYQIPYDYYYQVNNNLYDQTQYQYQQQEIAYDPMGYNQNHYQYQQPEIAYDPMGYNQNHYQYRQPEIAYDPMSYNNYYNWNGSESETTSASAVAYSVSTMSEPKHLFYEPNYYTTYESPPQFNIYRSVQGVTEQDFNEPEFDEYDPTPYNGGYDIVSTYGKPKPPSDITCYPSSNTSQGKLPSPPEIITPVPLGIYDGGEKKGEVKAVKKRVTFAEPVEEAKATETIKKEEEEEEQGDDDDDEDDDDDDDDDEEEEEDHSSSYGNEGSIVNVEREKEDHSLSHGSGNAENVEKGEVKALYVPSGYGLEATDICEAIFGGYFPCILRNKRRQKDEEDQAAYVSCWESNDSDPWKTTSDYLFGDLYPYGNENRVERNQFEIQSYGYRSY